MVARGLRTQRTSWRDWRVHGRSDGHSYWLLCTIRVRIEANSSDTDTHLLHRVAVASCLPAHSPVPIYTQGVLSKAVRWETLRGEMNFESEDEAKKHMQSFLNLASIDEILKFHRTPFSYVQISAVNDRYIPTDSAQLLYDIVAERCHTHAHELTWILGGHVSSVLIDRSNIIDAIVRSFKLLKQRQQEQVQEA